MAINEILDPLTRSKRTRTAFTATRVLVTDDYPNAYKDGPQYGDQHPAFPEGKVCEVEVEPFGKTTAVAGVYTHGKLIVQYSSAILENEGAVIRVRSIGQRALDVSPGRVWQATGLPCEAWISAVLPITELSVYHASLYLPEGTIIAAQGKVNKNPWLTYAPETVLFEGVEDEEEFDAIYGIRHRTVYKFSINPISWNLAPCPTGWDRTVPPVYESAYFETLFAFEVT